MFIVPTCRNCYYYFPLLLTSDLNFRYRKIFESIWYARADAESLTSVLRKLFVKLMHKTEFQADKSCCVMQSSAGRSLPPITAAGLVTVTSFCCIRTWLDGYLQLNFMADITRSTRPIEKLCLWIMFHIRISHYQTLPYQWSKLFIY